MPLANTKFWSWTHFWADIPLEGICLDLVIYEQGGNLYFTWDKRHTLVGSSYETGNAAFSLLFLSLVGNP